MYHNLLVTIKNAQAARRESVFLPFSRMDLDIAKVLVAEGYLKDAQKKTIGRKLFLEAKLRYIGGRGVLSNFRFMSKPSRHIYSGYREIQPVKQHYGVSVFSTPAGIMSGKQARKAKVGGEYLFQVW